MFAGEFVQRDTAVSQDALDAESSFFPGSSRHYFRAESNQHFRPCPYVFLFSILFVVKYWHLVFSFYLFSMFDFALRRVNFFFWLVLSKFLARRRRRFADRIENLALLFPFPIAHYKIITEKIAGPGVEKQLHNFDNGKWTMENYPLPIVNIRCNHGLTVTNVGSDGWPTGSFFSGEWRGREFSRPACCGWRDGDGHRIRGRKRLVRPI